MTTSIASKFKTHTDFICEAVRGIKDLRSNQKIYKKIYKYYKDRGVNFTGDTHTDYEIVLDYLYDEGFE